MPLIMTADRPLFSRRLHPSLFLGARMLTSEDYKELSNRFARLAIEATTPTVAEALMAIALDYVSRATTAPRGQRWHDQLAEFGDQSRS